ncbi:hypothetical protein [Luteimonas sp. e5]
MPRRRVVFLIAVLAALATILAFARWRQAQDTPAAALAPAGPVAEPVARPAFVSAQAVTAADCPLPLALADPELPAQSTLPDAVSEFAHPSGRLEALAGFSVDARVLSTRRYAEDREADFAPLDLALGWARMRDEDVLAALDIRQDNRWYYMAWDAAPPISIEQARRESANMHMIPASRDVAAALAGMQPGQRVRIDGWLVEAEARDGWRWRSSLTRDDHGPGGCEVVYVCAARIAAD